METLQEALILYFFSWSWAFGEICLNIVLEVNVWHVSRCVILVPTCNEKEFRKIDKS